MTGKVPPEGCSVCSWRQSREERVANSLVEEVSFCQDLTRGRAVGDEACGAAGSPGSGKLAVECVAITQPRCVSADLL